MLRGTIYKITSSMTPKIYIGSTTQPLHVRLQKHKYSFNNNTSCTSKIILQFEDAKIEELHILECESIKELRAKEQEFITLHKDVVVNRYLLDTKKNIQEKNKEKYKEYQKAYYKTEEFKTKNNISLQCEFCEKKFTKPNKSRHMKKYHL
jgi:hypothetical protein